MICGTKGGICAISFRRGKKGKLGDIVRGWSVEYTLKEGATPLLYKAATELSEYVRGERKSFTLKVDFLSGTLFERKVWSILQTIPYGKCVSYQWVGKMLGKQTASRAIGNAIGKNPVPILVPCHRVIRKDGTLGGFSSGIPTKKILLSIEGCTSYKEKE